MAAIIFPLSNYQVILYLLNLMIFENTSKVIILLIGVLFLFRFREFGRIAIKQRRELNKKLPLPILDSNFDDTAIRVSQIMFLVIGIVFTLYSVLNFLSL